MFEYSFVLYFLSAVPIFLILMLVDFYKNKKMITKVSSTKNRKIIPYYSEGQKILKIFFYTLGILLIIFALARPRWGYEELNTNYSGRDIYFLVDVSISMSVRDVVVSRIDLAKKIVRDYIINNESDRVALRVFAGNSQLLLPLTTDTGAVLFFLESLNPGYLEKQGTNIGLALMDTLKEFEFEKGRLGTIVLITDGEDLSGQVDDVIRDVRNQGISIYCIGIGTPNGQPIPKYDNKGRSDGFVKYNNDFVLSKLDESNLKMIAERTNGRFTISNGSPNEIELLIKGVKRSDRKNNDVESVKISKKKERYYIFLIPALIMFSLGFILDQGKILLKSTSKLTLIIVLFLLSMANINANSDTSTDTKIKPYLKSDVNGGYYGNKYFVKGKFNDALVHYYKALTIFKQEKLSKLFHNIGLTRYNLKEYDKAKSSFESALTKTTNKSLIAKYNYQKGLSAFREGAFGESAELFKKSLLLSPDNENARINYYIAKVLSDNNNKKQDEKQKEDQDEQENKKDQSTEDILKALEDKEMKNFEKDKQKNPMIYTGKYW